MTIDIEDDIVQDFLVESREILETLGEQLVDLEQQPQDRELLNAVFRGFHTIKGGAGFLSLDSLVSVCHRTEDLFNLLRQGDKIVTPELMDHVLKALDVVNDMFRAMESGRDLPAAPEPLLVALEALNVPDEARAQEVEPTTESEGSAESQADDTDKAFDQLLDALDGPADGAASGADSRAIAPGGDDITDEEFERLLDELHGQKQAGESEPVGQGRPAGKPESSAAEDISEEEFDALLDQIHGRGKAPAADGSPKAGKSRSGKAPQATKAPAAPSSASDVAAGKAAGSPADDAEASAKAGVSKAETTVRVDTAKLDDIMNLVGELVLVRNRLSTLRGILNEERMNQAVADLELVTSDLQAAVMKTRMQPIKKVFGRFPRLVRDLARNLKKEVELDLRGEETDLDKNLVEALADPLIHLVRNSVDHGIELPEERVAAGKPRAGHVVLSAEQEGDHILLTIQDDGKGMDPNFLRAKVVEKGLMDRESAARLDDADCFNLIFLPGFSTKAEISDISGRGVGMDVVKNRISQLNGSIDIHSVAGQGSTLRIKVPLTLAILPTLMVKVEGRKFALPMSVVREIFELDTGRTNVVDGRLVVMVRSKAMPLFFMQRWLHRLSGTLSTKKHCEELEGERQVVTVVLGNQAVGFVVDEVIGLEEVVIKPLGAMLQGLPGLAGSTITGDGRIALIVDIPSLVKSYGSKM